MKHIGIIINYNGSNGIVIDSNGNKYLLSKKNIIYPNPQNGDLVVFKEEKIETIEVKERIASFVAKIKIK